MKNIILIASLIISITAGAQEFPKPSPLAKTYQMVGLTEVEVAYSSPGVKGRSIFGDVVALDKLWRTGANTATVITFSEPTQFGDDLVPAGAYALFSFPMENQISFILNTNTDQGGTGSYDQTLDVAKTTVDFIKTKKSVERLNFSIENTTNDGADLRMSWDNRTCVVALKVFTEDQAIKKFKAKLEEYDNGEYQLYNQAASFFLEKGNAVEAVTYASKSVELKKKFWNTHTYAKALGASGDKAGAIEMAKESMALAKEADYQPYVKMNMDLITELEK